MMPRWRLEIPTSFALLMCASQMAFADAPALFIEQLQQLDSAYSNLRLRGKLTSERLYPFDHKDKTVEEVEYTQLGDRRRLIVGKHLTADVPESVYVSDPDCSFQVERHPDGKEIVRFLSPRRGFGQKEVRGSMMLKAFLFRLCCSFSSDPFSDMLRQGRLLLGDGSLVDPETPDRIQFEVRQLRPVPDVLASDSSLDYFHGTMILRTRPLCCVEELHLRGRYKDETPPNIIDAVITYQEPISDIPVIKSVQWTGSLPSGELLDRYTLEVYSLEFGVAKLEDFTLAGCGIKTVNTTGDYSNIPLLAWYGGLVLVVCVVGLWLIRKRQRSPE
jgi:hypothetical protein